MNLPAARIFRIATLIFLFLFNMAFWQSVRAGSHESSDQQRAAIFLQRASMVVADLDASIAFYQDVLGFTVTSRSDYSTPNFRAIFHVAEGTATEFALLDAANRQSRPIGLVEIEGQTPDVESNRKTAPAIVFGTEDMDGIHGRAIAAGIEIQVAPSPLIGFDGNPIGREMSLYDPDGIRVILFEMNKE